jgi:hypothetical protein
MSVVEQGAGTKESWAASRKRNPPSSVTINPKETAVPQLNESPMKESTGKTLFQHATTVRQVPEWKVGDRCAVTCRVNGADHFGPEMMNGTIEKIQDGRAWVVVPSGGAIYRTRVALEFLYEARDDDE